MSSARTKKPNPLLFLGRYLRRPRHVGAIAPSGRGLARAMLRGLRPAPGELVVELGPGTGPFTRELLKSGVAPADLVLVEFDESFAHHLRREFPGVSVVHGDAGDLPRILARGGHAKTRRILSGLPFRSLPPVAATRIARAIGDVLEPGGCLVQFSYFDIPPLPRADAEAGALSGRRIKFVLANVPPAFVWRYEKRAP